MAYTTVTDISSVTEFFNTTVITGVATVPFVGVTINATAKIIFIIVGLLEVVCGVAGNVLLLSALLVLGVDSYHLLFIANLAVSDLLTLGYWMAFFVLDLILGYHPVVNHAHCQANSFVVYACTAVSILSLTSITLNRYLHVCHNHLYSRVFNRRRILIWCLVLWLVAAVVCTPPLVGTSSYGYDTFAHICSSLNNIQNLYVNTVVTGFLSLSLVLVGYWNFAIFRYWKRIKLNLDRSFSMSPDNRAITSRLKRNQGKSEEETKLDTLQAGHPKKLDSNTLQASTRSDNNTNTTGAKRDLSQGGGGQSSIITQSGSFQDQGQLQVAQQLRSENETCVSDDRMLSRMLSSVKSVSLKDEFRTATKDALRVSGSETTVLASGSSKHECCPEDATNLSDVGGNASASVPTTVDYSLEVLSDIDQHHDVSSSRQYGTRIHKERERERALVRSLTIVFFLMFLCFVPFGVVDVFDASSPQPTEVKIATTLLLFLNNCVNWIVYGVMNRSFWRAYVKYLRRVVNRCMLRARAN